MYKYFVNIFQFLNDAMKNGMANYGKSEHEGVDAAWDAIQVPLSQKLFAW